MHFYNGVKNLFVQSQNSFRSVLTEPFGSIFTILFKSYPMVDHGLAIDAPLVSTSSFSHVCAPINFQQPYFLMGTGSSCRHCQKPLLQYQREMKSGSHLEVDNSQLRISSFSFSQGQILPLKSWLGILLIRLAAAEILD